MEWNPVFRRESRVRWRDERAFMLLFGLAALFSVVIIYFYDNTSLGGQDLLASARVSHDGHEIFKALSMAQVTAWLLIVPALAASGVAFERERGLLEALQLSGLAPARVILGKLSGIALFALVLMLVSLPPLALCFLIGGVAPDEFISVLKLQITLIFFCAALGLYCSARARRPQQALRNVFIALGLFLLLSTVGPQILTSLFYLIFLLLSGYSGGILRGFGRFNAGVNLFYWLSPVNMTSEIFESKGAAAFDSQLLCYWLVSLLLLFLASRHAARALPDLPWAKRNRYLSVRRGRLTFVDAEEATPLLPQKNLTFASKSASKTRSRWDVPLVSYLRFQNPVLQREVRNLLRLRKFSPLITVLLWPLGFACLVVYAWSFMWILGFPESARDQYQAVISLLLLIILVAAPLRGANGIARERENGTWETLRLSLLEPRTILWGKASAPLIFLTGLLLITAPLWIASFVSSLFHGSFFVRGYEFYLSPRIILGSVALLYATTFVLNAIGLTFSWRSRSSAAAIGWTLSLVLIVGLGLNSLGQNAIQYAIFNKMGYLYTMFYSICCGADATLYNYDGQGHTLWTWRLINDVQMLLKPWEEFQSFFRWYSPYDSEYFIPIVLHPFIASAFYFFIGWLLLKRLERNMKKTMTLEHETPSRRARDENGKGGFYQRQKRFLTRQKSISTE